MWPVDPVAIKSLKFDNEIYLIVYSKISVDIFDVLKGLICTNYAYTRATSLKVNDSLGEWIQTISIKNNVPIDKNGSLSLLSNDIENRFLFLSLNTNEIHLPKQMSDSGPRNVLIKKVCFWSDSNPRSLFYHKIRRNLVKFGKKKFVYSSGNQEKSRSSLKSQMNDPKARSKLISGPTDFKHVHHMGPESNVQNLIADPTPVKESFIFDYVTIIS